MLRVDWNSQIAPPVGPFPFCKAMSCIQTVARPGIGSDPILIWCFCSTSLVEGTPDEEGSPSSAIEMLHLSVPAILRSALSIPSPGRILSAALSQLSVNRKVAAWMCLASMSYTRTRCALPQMSSVLELQLPKSKPAQAQKAVVGASALHKHRWVCCNLQASAVPLLRVAQSDLANKYSLAEKLALSFLL